jgi:hypothetical protein
MSSIAPGSTYPALFTIPKIVFSLAFKIILLKISSKSSGLAISHSIGTQKSSKN